MSSSPSTRGLRHFQRNLVAIKGRPRPQERWGRANRELEGLLSWGADFPCAPSSHAHALRHTQQAARPRAGGAAFSPSAHLARAAPSRGVAVRSHTAEAVPGSWRRGPPGRPSPCAPQPRAERGGQLVPSAGLPADSIDAACFSILISGCYR